MSDLGGLQSFSTPQRQIVILCSFITLPKAANLPEKLASINSQMTDIILPQQKFRIPIRLKEWPATHPRLIDLVLVRVNEARRGIVRDRSGNNRQRVLGQQIILIKQ